MLYLVCCLLFVGLVFVVSSLLYGCWLLLGVRSALLGVCCVLFVVC